MRRVRDVLARRWAVNPKLLSQGVAGIAGIAEMGPVDA